MQASLSQLLDTLGTSSLQLVIAPRGEDEPVSGTVIHEPRAGAQRLDDMLLLAVGVRPTSADAVDLVREAGRCGVAGVVVKCYHEPLTELATVAEDAGVALLAAEDDLAWHQLVALVSSALAASRRRDRSAAGPDTGDLFALANAIAASVGGATAIEDPYQRILAYSTLPEQPVDDERRQGILGLRVPYAAANDAQYRELSRATGVCRFESGPGGLARLAVPVRAGGEFLGSVWVIDAADKFGPEAEHSLAEAADIAALHVLHARTSRDLARHRRGDLLRRLLEDPASAELVAPQLGLRADAASVVAAFVVASDDPEGVEAARAALRLTDLVSLHCEAHYSSHSAALVDGTVYALLPADGKGSSHRTLVADMAERAARALRTHVHAAVGPVVGELRDAASSRQDADLVLRVLAARHAHEWAVATIDDVRASVTLTELAGLLSTMPRLREGPGHVVHGYDDEHGTAYADTLHAYFSAGGDIAKAARSLSVHPNTCRYRLARAGELFGLDIDDPDQRLVLWLQLRLSRLDHGIAW